MNFGAQVITLLTQMGWITKQTDAKVFGKGLKEIFDRLNIGDKHKLGIFKPAVIPIGADAVFPFAFDRVEGTYKAFIIPKEGMFPEVAIQGEEVYVPTYRVSNAIDWPAIYKRDQRKDIVIKAVEIFLNGFADKIWDDQIKIITVCGVDSKNLAFKAKSLQDAMYLFSRRSGKRITDIVVEPEMMADFVAAKRERDRKEEAIKSELLVSTTEDHMVFIGPDGKPIRIHCVQDISDFYSSWSKCMANLELEKYRESRGVIRKILDFCLPFLRRKSTWKRTPICVALNLENSNFVQVVRQQDKKENGKIVLFPDPVLARKQREGFYGWMEIGAACFEQEQTMVFEEFPVE